MKTVWVLTSHEPFEGESPEGVAISKRTARKWVMERASRRRTHKVTESADRIETDNGGNASDFAATRYEVTP